MKNVYDNDLTDIYKAQGSQVDEWDECMIRVRNLYGDELADKLSTLIDEGQVEEVNLILKYI